MDGAGGRFKFANSTANLIQRFVKSEQKGMYPLELSSPQHLSAEALAPLAGAGKPRPHFR